MTEAGGGDAAVLPGPGSPRSAGLPLELLWQDVDLGVEGEARGGPLPEALADRYEASFYIPLRPDGPTVVANFVSSLDGIVALSPDEHASGGGEISGFSESDKFMMALLRAVADVVIVGAGTVRVGHNHEWTARRVQPSLAGVVEEWRASLGLAPQPATIVVTASGALDPKHPGLSARDVPGGVATTQAGAERLAAQALPANIRVEAVAGSGEVRAASVVELVSRLGARVALLEGGPHLFGDFLEAGLVDELFLTLAPQLLGRSDRGHRLGLVEGKWLGAGRSRWSRLVSVRRAGDDLFLRYRFDA